jgi:hypothetical protein
VRSHKKHLDENTPMAYSPAFAYKKNEASDLTASQVKQLRAVVEEWLHEKE